jgi:hypothetical protein
MGRYAAFVVLVLVLAATALEGAASRAAQAPQIPGGVNIPGGGRIDLTKPPMPVITSPRPGARVGNPIAVRGTAKPATRVRVTATLVVAVPLTGIKAGLGSAQTTASADGRWSVSIGYTLPAGIPNARIQLSAVSSTPITDLKSDAATLEVLPAKR